jgi:hypothetical protein
MSVILENPSLQGKVQHSITGQEVSHVSLNTYEFTTINQRDINVPFRMHTSTSKTLVFLFLCSTSKKYINIIAVGALHNSVHEFITENKLDSIITKCH